MALLQNMTCNLRHPMSLRHPVPAREQIYIYIYMCMFLNRQYIYYIYDYRADFGKFIRIRSQLANKYVCICVCVSYDPIFATFTITEMITELTFEKFYNQSILSCEQIYLFTCIFLNTQYIYYIY